MIETSRNKHLTALDYFRTKINESESSKSALNLRKAVDSFARFICGNDLEFADIGEVLLGEWVSKLLYEGYTVKTVSYYVKLVASLYNKAVKDGLAGANDSFSILQSNLNASKSLRFDGMIDSGSFEKVQAIARMDVSACPDRQLAKDILLFAIYMGGLTFTEISNYTKEDYKGDRAEIQDIISRNSKPRNKYLFPLHQSQTTQAKINRRISTMLSDLFKRVDLNMATVSNDTPRQLWCILAMRSGISASDIAGYVAPYTATSPISAFAVPSNIDESKKESIKVHVTEALSCNPVCWYAMQFRRGVTFEAVKERMDNEGLKVVELFYPMEEITRKIGKKMVTENKPVISGVLFFRQRVTELGKLYARIGDLAWGYRRTRDMRSPYAVISQAEISRYQETIGTFSSSTELRPVGTFPLSEGDRLVIIGGMLSGYPATYIGETKTGKETGRTVYRMLLPGDNKCEWIVENDPRLVKKITEAQYRTLLTNLSISN